MFLQALGLGFKFQLSAMKSLSLGFRSFFASHRNVRAYMYPTQTKDVSKAILAAIDDFMEVASPCEEETGVARRCRAEHSLADAGTATLPRSYVFCVSVRSKTRA